VNPAIRLLKTIREVGLQPVLRLGLYRFGLLTGHYRRITDPARNEFPENAYHWCDPVGHFMDADIAIHLREKKENHDNRIADARMILGGKCRIFGHLVVDIQSSDWVGSPHWTRFESSKSILPPGDIKFIWEPARLGWIYALARAYPLGKISGLGKSAWDQVKEFLRRNPVYDGPNWMNGQEVALRLIALVFLHEVFRNDDSMPPDWEDDLAKAVLEHAKRLPSTLVYAESQQNNHLLVEAAGMYTAGVFLPGFSESRGWREKGWRLFHSAIDAQIYQDGTYGQFSTNYHRLMLQIALWMKSIGMRAGDEFPENSTRKLAAATIWLKNLSNGQAGLVPNYGHNDGAYLFPLTGKPMNDFSPVIRTCERFFGLEASSGSIQEMALWFEWLSGRKIENQEVNQIAPPVKSYRKLEIGETSAVMFTPQYFNRPGQADVLQTEIWRNGQPFALDAGSYLYNGDPPWNNRLSLTKYHNTVSMFDDNQMQQAGRFLWLNWPKVESGVSGEVGNTISGKHDGYRRYGIDHERKISYINENVWRVVDNLIPVGGGFVKPYKACLHWLLPSLDWTVVDNGLQIGDKHPPVMLLVTPLFPSKGLKIYRQVIQAGELLYSDLGLNNNLDEISTFGWESPTYALKQPAVSYRIFFSADQAVTILSEFQFFE
jgi:hypothetical protein